MLGFPLAFSTVNFAQSPSSLPRPLASASDLSAAPGHPWGGPGSGTGPLAIVPLPRWCAEWVGAIKRGKERDLCVV